MSFLSGIFLLALPLIAMPVVIHFMRRRRREVTPWGAMQFLKVSSQRDSRLSNLDRWLLMMLRMLAIACLIGAIAQPAFHLFGAGKPALTPQVLMIDDTRSTLAVNAKGQETFEVIRQAALKWMRELPSGTPSEVWLVGSPPQRIGISHSAGTSEQNAVRREVETLTPRGGSADFAENVRRIISSATVESKDAEPSEQEPSSLPPRMDFWLLTDTGNAGWQEKFSPIQLTGHQRNHVHCVVFGGASEATAQNFQLCVESIQPDRSRVFRGSSVRLVANVQNHGGATSPPVECVWKRDGEVFAVNTLPSLEAHSVTSIAADLIMDNPGTQPITLELKRPGDRPLADTLAADDSAGAVIRVMDQQPILVIVGKATEQALAPTETDYLGAALGHSLGSWKSGSAGQKISKPKDRSQSLYRPVVKFDDELQDVQWQSYPVIVLMSDAEISESAEKQLIAAVRAGTGLWLTLGSDSQRELKANFLSSLGLMPEDPAAGAIGDLIVHTDAEKMDRIHPPDTNDEVIEALADTDRLDLDEVRIRRRYRLNIHPSDQHRVVLRTFDGDALAVLSSVSQGRVVVQSVPLDPSWSNFPLSNSFVVWVVEILDELAASKAEQHNLMLGQMLRAEVPEVDHRYAIRTPDGQATEVIALPSSAASEQTSGIIRHQQTDRPGHYSLVDLDHPSDEADGVPAISYWINVDPAESDLTSTNAQSLSGFAKHPQISLTSGPSDFDPARVLGKIKPQRQARPQFPLWPWLLMGMLVAILLETFLAGYAALRRYGRFRSKAQNDAPIELAANRQPLETKGFALDRVAKTMIFGFVTFASASSSFAESTVAVSGGDQVSIQEGMSLEGIFDASTAIVLMIVAMIAALVWLLRQRELLGNYTTAVLACLRLTVIAAAIWMLTEPNWTRTETLSRPSEILLLADNSASMETVDSPDSATAQAWSRAIDGQSDDHARVQTAVFHLKVAIQNLDRMGEPSVDSIERALEPLRSLTSEQASDVVPAKLALENAIQSASESSATRDLVEQRALVASYGESIQTALLELETFIRSGRSTGVGAAPVERSRKEYVSELLDQIEGRWAAQSSENGEPGIRLQRAVFSGRVTPADAQVDTSWKTRLESETLLETADSEDIVDPRTDISGALSYVSSVATSRRIAAVVMLSEGQHNAQVALSPVEVAMGLPEVPVFTVAIGDASRRKDVSIHRVNAPSIVYADDAPVIEVLVSAHQCKNDSVDVTLSLGDKVVETKAVTFPSSEADVAVRFDVPKQSPGRHEYSVTVSALGDEVNVQNNKGYAAIETIRSKLYVLIADGRPRWESRYLELLLRRDPRVVLDKVLLKPTVKTTVGTQAQPFPENADGWSKFDVVVLGDLPPTSLTGPVQEAMTQYVKSGGRLIVVAGEQHMPADFVNDPWFDLLPITNVPLQVSSGQRPAPTMEGMLTSMLRLEESIQDSGLLWQRSMSGPPPGFVSPFHAAKPTASVLATLAFPDNWTSDGYAVPPENSNVNSGLASWLAVHRVGRGRVAYLSSPVTYRLRIRRGDKFHHQFWGQIIRYMTSSDLAMGDGQMQIQTDRSQYDEGEQPRIRVRMRTPDGQPVRGAVAKLLYATVGDEATPKSVELKEDLKVAGTYVAVLSTVSVGVYHAWVQQNPAVASQEDSTPVTFTVQALQGLEALRTEANPMLMKEIAEATGGISIDPALVSEIPKAVSLKPEVSQRREAKPLWNRWSSLGLIVGGLSMEWFIRRRRGLV